MTIRRPFMLTSLSAALLLAGCGGSGSSGTPTSQVSTASITGTVPGTLIEALCTDGSYYSTHSTDDGSSQHPFSLTLPAGINCQLVMTTNEGQTNQIITPIRIQSNGVTSGLMNTTVAFNLGYVPLLMDRADPAFRDTNGDGVVDEPLVITPDLPEGTNLTELSQNPLDSDNDGIPNVYEDDDNDGEYNKIDDDDDNDGTADVDETDDNDRDDDGIDDRYDSDDDNDGIKDDEDDDDDNDGVRDSEDTDHDDANDTSSNTSTNYTPVSAYTLTTGRLLAAQCAMCHGTNGHSTNGWDSIAGESASETIEEMREFQSGGEDEPIMEAQAHGYSDAEIEALAAWLATQSSSEGED